MADNFASSLTGGLFGSSPNYAQAAASSERRRRGIIDLGLRQINAVFGGGDAPFYSLAAPDPFTRQEWHGGGGKNQSFYTLSQSGKFVPYYAPKAPHGGQTAAEKANIYGGGVGSMVHGLSTGDLKAASLGAAFGLPGQVPLFNSIFGKDQPSVREIVNSRLKKGLLFSAPEYQTFEGFQPEFFRQRAKAYENYALPQLAQQYQQARNQTLYGLANRGLSKSSVGQQAVSSVNRMAGEGRQRIAEEGVNQANQVKRDLEASRQQAIAQLYQTSDPSQAFQTALSAASNARVPSVFGPIANMFGNVANQYYLNRVLNSPMANSGTAGQNYFAPVGTP